MTSKKDQRIDPKTDRKIDDSGGIDLELAGAIALVAFNRPKRRNALDMPTRARLANVIDQVTSDESVRVIVLTGRGAHFCAGGDLTSMESAEGMSAEAGRRRMRNALRVVERLYTCDKLVVAAVEGCAYGGGFGLALLADMIVASETARFCMSFAKIGLVPDSASLYTLPRIVGVQRAKELMLSGREIDAATALDYGIAMEVVGEGAALERAMEIARALAGASPAASGLAKTALNNSLSSDFRTMLEFEAAAQGLAFASEYHRGAVKDFLAKRAPPFAWAAKAR